jgi:hypothetical protein
MRICGAILKGDQRDENRGRDWAKKKSVLKSYIAEKISF